MSWWCSAGQERWTWAWRAYPGIWMLVAGAAVGYAVTMQRRRADGRWQAGDRRRVGWFGAAIILFWIATDWPVGPLGAGYLASVHMAQYQIYTLLVAPLLMLGLPEDVARTMVSRLRLQSLVPQLARPVVAGLVFNLVLFATHAPFTVDALRTSQGGSFALDMVWLASGLVLWLPIISPLPELRHPSPAVRCVYLFLAAGALAMIPGALITFAPFPLYRVYELAPRVGDISALDDQQVAGIVMKIGNLPIIWIVLCVTFVRWARREGSISYVTIPSGGDAVESGADGSGGRPPGVDGARADQGASGGADPAPDPAVDRAVTAPRSALIP